MQLAGLEEVLDDVEVASLLDRGFRRLAKTRQHWHAPVGDRRTIDRLSDAQRGCNRLQAGLRALVEQSIGHLANAWSLRRWWGCCTASGRSSGPPARRSALAAGCTGSPRDRGVTDTLTGTPAGASQASCGYAVVGVGSRHAPVELGIGRGWPR
jgi:hypothetical protein